MVEEKMTKFCLHGPESQKAARKRLENAYAAGRFPQALLIEGNRGLGKKALAIEVARMLSCTNSEQVPLPSGKEPSDHFTSHDPLSPALHGSH